MPNQKSHGTPIDKTLVIEDSVARVERIRASKYEEGLERERVLLVEQRAKIASICDDVKAGDRQSMLELIELTSDNLRVFDVLPKDLRIILADGLKIVVTNLSQSPDFPSGKLAAIKKRKEENAVYITALQVEYKCYREGLTREDAKSRTAEEWQISESLVDKRWKLGHRKAKETIKMLQGIDEVTGRLQRTTK